MAEQKTTQQQAREQFKVAENTAHNMLRGWNEAFFATTEWTFDMFERNLRYSQDLRSQNERVMGEALASFRGMYQDGVKSWQGYVQGINDIALRML